MSPRKWRRNTYGYARAEVVGALVNSVFLFALCFSIAMGLVAAGYQSYYDNLAYRSS